MSKFKYLSFFLIFFFVVIFFKPFIFNGLIPIPADTIVGLYHPYRDFYAKEYPRGIPFKNFIVTDPVRQQFPWKYLVIEQEKKGQLPLWNPYTFAGGPLLGNIQSGAFYFLNIIFFLLPFSIAWGIFILLQPLLAAIFLFLYLESFKLAKKASILGAVAFAFGGFSVSWLEWGNVIHTALWLPLILLSIDKILFLNKKLKFNIWWVILLFSLLSSFFAGHLQLFFYTIIFSFVYFVARVYKLKNRKKIILKFSALFSVFVLISSVFWIPSLEFILLSARGVDQDYRMIEGWFIPWQNIIQLIIPDFFGNPSTLNYFGVWNYGEFVNYVGIGSLLFALFSFLRKDKKTLFFIFALLISFVFAFPTIIAKIPYKFDFPFLSTSQPTRLIFIANFCLSVLAALGFDYFLKTNNKKKIVYILFVFIIIFVCVWIFVLFFAKNISIQNLLVIRQNLILPTILLAINILLILSIALFKNKKLVSAFSIIIIFVLFFDLLRFGWKYLPFTPQKYLYPYTKTLEFLKDNLGNYRYLATDSRIFPPNFSVMYKFQSLDGYDPLYLENYAEFIAAIGRKIPNTDKPFGFNRIITLQSTDTSLINILGVKYIITFDKPGINPNYKKVFTEGQTNIYENLDVLPRTFFAWNVYLAKDNKDAIEQIFRFKDDLRTNAIVQDFSGNKKFSNGEANIVNYSENKVEIMTKNIDEGFLVLTDSYYPSWHAKIDGIETKIYKTNYSFRGIVVPSGNHKVEFYVTLF